MNDRSLPLVGPRRLIANVSLMFRDRPLLDRMRTVQAAGIDKIELWWPFSSPSPRRREIDALTEMLTESGVSLVSMNLFSGNPLLGDRGVLSWPEYAREVGDSVSTAVAVSRLTGCRLFNVPYGERRTDGPDAESIAAARLGEICRRLESVSGTALLEPLSDRASEYPLMRGDQAVRLIDRVGNDSGAENCGYLLDVFHAVTNREDPVALISAHDDHIRHVQVADSPGRRKPGTGQIDFGPIFDALAARNYSGFVSCEYETAGASDRPDAEFDWVRSAASPGLDRDDAARTVPAGRASGHPTRDP